MAAADFLHHENPPTWAWVEPATLGPEEQRQTNHLTQSAEAQMHIAFFIMAAFYPHHQIRPIQYFIPSSASLKTVWCALWAGGIISPYFKNDEGHNVTVNGDRYRAMITNFFIPELNNHDVQELWFQQDGATCHTARATIDLLKDTFGDRLISRFGPVNWLQDLVI
ncbi:uncharacterized protein TNCV_578371 [Trichonephila clavipes]|nr:uncharacterized protein TNCV_578371 [Trichonephila clavipes]